MMIKMRLFFANLFIILFLLPIKVEALNYKEDYIDSNNIVAFNTDDEIDIYDFDEDDSNVYINTHGNGQYALTKYNIDIKVNENRTYNISESITAHFNVKKHGISRRIPTRNKIVRLDGTKDYIRAKISNITVNEQYDVFIADGYKIIQIGDPNLTLIGSKNYMISYLYNDGKDRTKNYDEFYYNLIGNGWDTTISDIEFTITMPKDFDETKLGFSRGALGSTDSSNIQYSVDGNVISGRYNGVLNAGEGLTVRIELPEGYFVGASNNLSFMTILLFVIPPLFTIISFILWIKHGKDEKVIETVEFYPPEGLNSAEVGLLYKGYATKNDVVSLLPYLADKGYIKIEEPKSKSTHPIKNDVSITKLKEYDGSNVSEKLLFEGLFGTTENDLQTKLSKVTFADLYDKFYVTLAAIINHLNSKENKNAIFDKVASRKSIAILVMFIVSLIIAIGIPLFECAGIKYLGFAVFLVLFFMPFYAFLSSAVFIVIPMSLTVLFSFIMSTGFLNDYILLIGFLIGIVCSILTFICFKIMPKRTPYGSKMLGKIRGFKNFLKNVEKVQLEKLVSQNPSYFFNILPFTYVLGVSNEWIQKFEAIDFYTTEFNDYDVVSYGNFMNSTVYSFSQAQLPNASSSGDSGGGSSSGGSSGGGSGGGGGGSW